MRYAIEYLRQRPALEDEILLSATDRDPSNHEPPKYQSPPSTSNSSRITTRTDIRHRQGPTTAKVFSPKRTVVMNYCNRYLLYELIF